MKQIVTRARKISLSERVAPALLAAVALSGAATKAHATLLYWDGGTGTFATAANWSTAPNATTPNPAAAPTTTDEAIFNQTNGYGDETITIAAQSVHSLQVTNTGSTTLTATSNNFTTGAGGISIASGAGAFSVASTILFKINNSQTWTNDSSNVLTIGGSLSGLTGQTDTLTVNGAGGVTFNGIGGTGTNSTSLVIDATGAIVTFAVGNTFDGGITLQNGTLFMGGVASSNFGAIANALTVNTGIIDLNATATKSYSVGSLSGLGGTIMNNGSAVATLSIGTGDTGGGTFAGTIIDHNNAGTGMVTLKKVGLGKISLTGANTYSGGTLINGGALIVNNLSGSGTGLGAITYSLTTSGTIGGTGKIGGVAGASAANIAVSGSNASVLAIVSPGALDGSGNSTTGTLTVGSSTVNNNVTFNNFGELLIQLDTSTNDLLAVNGNLTMPGGSDILALSLLTSTPQSTYTVATYSGTSAGTFASVIFDGTTYASASLPTWLKVNYGTGSNSSIIVSVPEPSPMAGLGMVGLASLLMSRRVRASVLSTHRMDGHHV